MEESIAWETYYSGQATTFDKLKQPWIWNDDLGPLVAPRADGVGDGAYVYQRMPGPHGEVLVPTQNPELPHRWTGARKAMERHCRFLEACAFITNWAQEHAARRAKEDSEPAKAVSETSDDDDLVVPFVSPVDTYAKEDEVSQETAPPTKKRQRQEAAGPSSLVSPYDGTDKELLAMCSIGQHARATTGRIDLTVTVPDGRSFRSKLAALRYMRGS